MMHTQISYQGLVRIIIKGLLFPGEPSRLEESPAAALFFEPTLRFALRLLQANSRDEAGRFWPLNLGENQLALAYSKHIQWKSFPYTIILVPGAGSEVPGVPLSPWGKERLRYAVDVYRSGKAPFILVSGGFVHPSQTPFCEAIEMKRYLMEAYSIPERAILVDPYARHTTTNLRNAAREIADYGLPLTKAFLIVTDTTQSSYIAGAKFAQRDIDELGYQPVLSMKRLSPTEIEAEPSAKVVYVDPLDPLDP